MKYEQVKIDSSKILLIIDIIESANIINIGYKEQVGCNMLYITQNMDEICYAELMRVYEESNRKYGEKMYSRFTCPEQILLAEQDLYSYLRSVLNAGGWLAIWEASGCYQSVLRLEPYADGLLITALETALETRNKGHANELLHAVVQYFPQVKIYTHIYADNKISLHLHEKNGFVQVQDYAEFLDGSVSTDAYTYRLTP